MGRTAILWEPAGSAPKDGTAAPIVASLDVQRRVSSLSTNSPPVDDGRRLGSAGRSVTCALAVSESQPITFDFERPVFEWDVASSSTL